MGLASGTITIRSSETSDDTNMLPMESIDLVPLFYRHVEQYSTEFEGNLTANDREILHAQLVADSQNDFFAPDADDHLYGLPQEYTPFGTFVLGDVFHIGDQSVIFEIHGHPELLIKYQTNCEEIDSYPYSLHPLILDYWYMRESFMLGLSPEPLFLSPPSLFERLYGVENDRKYIFKMDATDALGCTINAGVVRYMIMRRSPGVSLHLFRYRYPNLILPMDIAANITSGVIRGLQRLHTEARIVHGDIHNGNILVERNPENEQYKILFIDFGRAFRDNESFTNDRVNEIGQWDHFLCSPWQMDGRAWGRRDDIYKAVQSFAIVTNPTEYCAREEYAMQLRGVEGSIGMKLNRFMFRMASAVKNKKVQLTSSYDPLWAATRSNPAKRNDLTMKLAYIQDLVTNSLADINSPISYGELIAGFEEIVHILTL